MTNTEIEKYIHEQVMGLNARHLSHFWQMPEGDTVFKCSRCFQRRGLENSDQCGRPEYPAYTQSLDAVRPAEEKVIEMVGAYKYGMALIEIFKSERSGVYMELAFILATAEQRSRAVVAAHLEGCREVETRSV